MGATKHYLYESTLAKICAAAGYWYRPIYAGLLMMLAVNRLISVFGVTWKREKSVYKFILILIWVFLFLTIIYPTIWNSEFTYRLDISIYYCFCPTVVTIEFYTTLSFCMGSLICYVGVFSRYSFLRCLNNHRMTKVEAVILAQAFFAFLPIGILRCVKYFNYFRKLIDASEVGNLIYNVSYRSLPLLNLVTLLWFNP
ncbi:hypothetical protein L596_029515 [Steinernema carpocapsae]|uniref:G-protein coupled receptors family 1 profile domain-containing protein n=1 Tax=Steinernema carpocapsae TaxID=34508 RepID=A0A4U5LUU7_STECR|nr:hypothetical protein L596_029501 [Steinernema carpocapsae]TKR59908.1 hypothetical protein L596_029515 [Steinernema carpocapsae]